MLRHPFVSALLLIAGISAQADIHLEHIQLPPGFSISVFARNVPGARSMTVSPSGTLFVGTMGQGKVYALKDANDDHVADEVITVARSLNTPNGVAFREGSLYVAEISRIIRYDQIESQLDRPPAPVVVKSGLPTDRHHGWKFIAFGPDGKLYVPVGAPCNVCSRADERYASILRMQPDGSGTEVFAHGVRNTVGFDWHPTTHELWFTDNGRDMMGDDIPPDELNHATAAGMNFGFPYCHGSSVLDPEFGKGHACTDTTAPALEFGAHVAALGMRFYQGTQFPKEYGNQIFVAQHGSWNRSTPSGYRVVVAKSGTGNKLEYETFAEGWLHNDVDWGRPVDVLVWRDGSLLVSDDLAGAIYRISYTAPSQTTKR